MSRTGTDDNGLIIEYSEYCDYLMEFQRFAKAGSVHVSKRAAHRFTAYKKGDYVDINPRYTTHAGWKKGVIQSMDPESGQIKVCFRSKNGN